MTSPAWETSQLHVPVEATVPARGVPGMPLPLAGDGKFTVPPLDGSMLVPSMIDFHIVHSPDWVFARYLDVKGQLVEMRWKWTVGKAIHIFAREVARKYLGTDLDQGQLSPLKMINSGGKGERLSRPVVAVIAHAPHQTYLPVFFGLLRAGAVPFLISTNNSAEAIAHLLKTSGSSFVLRGPGGSAPDVDAAIDRAIEQVGPQQAISFIPYPTRDFLFGHNLETQPFLGAPFPAADAPLDSPCAILHSSGTTSFPKPIVLTQFHAAALARQVWWGDRSSVGRSFFVGHLPPFHALCLYLSGFFLIGGGWTVHLRKEAIPPKPVTPENIIEELVSLPSEVLIAVPSFFDAWSRDEAVCKVLRNMECAFGGGPLSSLTAQRIEAAGVSLQTAVGITEIGLVTRYPCKDNTSSAFRLNNMMQPFFRPVGQDQYELLLGPRPGFVPHVLNDSVQIDGQEQAVYATSDVVEFVQGSASDPDNAFIKIVGRADDQIMHSSGEKTNPGPLVDIIDECPDVKACLYFGRQKPHVGLLVEPKTPLKSHNEADVAQFRNRIWPWVKKANAFAPSHSALFKEMIVVASEAKPWERTAKGSLRSGAIVKLYYDEIEAAYSAFETIAESDIKVPQIWTTESTLDYIRQVVGEAVGSGKIDDDTDIFAMGADSLKATKIRNVVAKAADKRLQPTFIYSNPTVSAMAGALLDLVSGSGEEEDDAKQVVDAAKHVQAMETMLQKYAKDLPTRSAAAPAVNGSARGHAATQTILVTGTTGGMGSHILDELVKDPNVVAVYAANRSSRGHSLLERQRQALRSRGVDESVATSPKVRLIEIDTERVDLGIDKEIYVELTRSLTCIIHNAWRLDFNLALSSFESHIKGTNNLIRLSLRSTRPHPPRIVFTSSIATVRGAEGPTGAPELPLETFYPSVGFGYGESKAVCERLLAAASSKAKIPTTIVRIGQMSGSNTNGAWATSDWVPLIFKSFETVNCLPSMPDEDICWIASDVAAKALIEFVASSSPSSSLSEVLHIVSPRTAKWDDVMQAAISILGNGERGKLVPYAAWVDAIKDAGQKTSPEKFPTSKLSGFYEAVVPIASAKLGPDREAMGPKRLLTDKSTKRSQTLSQCEAIKTDDVRKWLHFWFTVGFLKP